LTKKKNKPLLKRIRIDAAYLAILAVIGVFRILPRRAALALGSFLGRVAPYLARHELRLAREHLTIAFGGEKDNGEISRLARETFRYLALNFVDTIRLRRMSGKDIISVSIPHNMDRFTHALEQGQGVIGLTSHAGCWELLGAYLAASGFPVAAIARRLYDPRLEDILLDTRRHFGMFNISRGYDTREIIRVLKKGYLLGILIDQDTKVKGEFVDFFGRPAHTATAAAQLSLRYGSPILPIMTWRDENHMHHIWIGEPVEIEPSDDNERDIAELTARCSKATEDFIREHPEQWVWFHRRWKTNRSK